MLTTLQSVLDHWGEMSGAELSRMTHTDGGPWCQVTETLDELSPHDPRLTHEALTAWFSRHPVTRYRSETTAGGSQWSLVPGPDAPGLRGAVKRAAAGEVIRHSRPT